MDPFMTFVHHRAFLNFYQIPLIQSMHWSEMVEHVCNYRPISCLKGSLVVSGAPKSCFYTDHWKAERCGFTPFPTRPTCGP